MKLRVAPVASSSGCADGECASCPADSLPRLRLPAGLRVAPHAVPSGISVSASPGCPGSCGSGWVDDDSPARLELCILSRAGDESSLRSGSCTFLPDAGWSLNFAAAFHRRTSRLRRARCYRFSHRPVRPELRLQFPTGSPTEKERRPVALVDSSAKRRKFCGYHQGWCINRRPASIKTKALSSTHSFPAVCEQRLCFQKSCGPELWEIHAASPFRGRLGAPPTIDTAINHRP